MKRIVKSVDLSDVISSDRIDPSKVIALKTPNEWFILTCNESGLTWSCLESPAQGRWSNYPSFRDAIDKVLHLGDVFQFKYFAEFVEYWAKDTGNIEIK